MNMYNPPHPGKVLRRLYMEPLNMSVVALALALGVRRPTISSLVNGKSGISPQMAIKLSRAFNTTPDLWLGMQMSYDLWQAQQLYDGHEIQRLYG
jgi:addiction module HigA family antidote